eukprot:TRINITY_DN76665_c0_g1_i1.p1 TRINITY_DN76665_c0_g1~~TRINITY_DN76665_c0_g1_i1.p1  ORF type:complete len:216 (-),score=48.69 TRINITY_DN76665_c0_g1_i1:379-1026(-)
MSPSALFFSPLLALLHDSANAALATQHFQPMQTADQEMGACLRRVGGLPKAEAYGALCASVTSLYHQQRDVDAKFVALSQENEHLQRAIQQSRSPLLAQQSSRVKREEERIQEVSKENAALRAEAQALRAELEHLRAEAQATRAELEETKRRSVAEVRVVRTDLNETQHRLKAEVEDARIALNDEKQSHLRDVRSLTTQLQAVESENAQLVSQCA